MKNHFRPAFGLNDAHIKNCHVRSVTLAEVGEETIIKCIAFICKKNTNMIGNNEEGLL